MCCRRPIHFRSDSDIRRGRPVGIAIWRRERFIVFRHGVLAHLRGGRLPLQGSIGSAFDCRSSWGPIGRPIIGGCALRWNRTDKWFARSAHVARFSSDVGSGQLARLVYSESIKPCHAARTPIRRRVILLSQPASHKAEETVSRRIDDDADVPRPRNQISRVRIFHARERFASGVNLIRARVRIFKSRVGIDLVNQVRTVLRAAGRQILLPRDVQN